MKLLVLADLHLDDYPSAAAREPLAAAIRTAARKADALIIAGDLTESGIVHWDAALDWLAALYPPEKSMRRLGPIDLALVRCREGAERSVGGSSSGTTRRGPYVSRPC